MASLDLLNYEEFIVVRYNSTGVERYLRKAKLLIQKNGSSSIQLFNPDFEVNLVYTDVNSPSTSDIQQLVDLLLLWSRNGGFDDNFGDQRFVERTIVFDVKSTFGISELRDRVNTTGAGSVTNNVGDPEYSLSVTDADDTAQLQTKDRGVYLAGTSGQAGLAVRTTNATFGVDQSVAYGYFDDNDGAFFLFNENGINVVIRRAGIDNVINGTDFNGDKLDGTGPSGTALDMTRGQIFQVEYTWYGYGSIVFYVILTYNDIQRRQIVHRFVPAGATSLANPNLPLTVRLVNGPNATSSQSAFVGGRQYSVIGRKTMETFRTTSAYRTQQSIDNADGFVPLISVRRKPDYLGYFVQIRSTDLLPDSNILFQVRVNATLSGATFEDPPDTNPTETALEFDTSATGFTGGIALFTGVVSGGRRVSAANNNELKYTLHDDDIITIAAFAYANNSSSVTSVLRMEEDW